MKNYLYTALLYISAFMITGAAVSTAVFLAIGFTAAELIPAYIIAGSGIVLIFILYFIPIVSKAPDVIIYGSAGVIVGIITLIAQVFIRQAYGINGFLFFSKVIHEFSFTGKDTIFFIILATLSLINGFVILLTIGEYKLNAVSYFGENILSVFFTSVIASLIGIAISFTSLSFVFPIFMAFWFACYNCYTLKLEITSRKIFKVIALGIIILGLAIPLSVFELSIKSFSYTYTDINDEYCALSVNGKSGGKKNLKIPTEHDGKKVGSISISGSKNLEYLYIPETVFEIDIDSSEISGISEIEISEKNEYYKVSDGAIYDIPMTELVLLPSSRTSYEMPETLKEIGDGALSKYTLKSIEFNDIFQPCEKQFMGLKSLESITLGATVTEIPNQFAQHCSNLTEIKLRSTITSIGEYAFSSCSKLENIPLQDSVTSIGMYAFSGCAAIKSVKIPLGVEKLEEAVFKDCSKLESIDLSNITYAHETSLMNTAIKELQIPDTYVNSLFSGSLHISTLERITASETHKRYLSYDGALYDKKDGNIILCYVPYARTELIISDEATSVSNSSFLYQFRPDTFELSINNRERGNLQKITVGNSIKNVSFLTYIPKLRDVTLGKSVTYVSTAYFTDALEYITVAEEHPFLASDNGILYAHSPKDIYSSYGVYIPPKMSKVVFSDKYSSGSGLKYISLKEDGNISLEKTDVIFNGPVEELTITNKTATHYFSNASYNTKPGYYSQLKDKGLKKLIVKGSVSIDAWSFSGCTELGEVVFESDDAEINKIYFIDGCFYGCSSLRLENLPVGTQHIYEYAFHGTQGRRFSLGNNLKKLHKNAFDENCEWLEVGAGKTKYTNMNGVVISPENEIIVPNKIKRIIFTKSDYDLPKLFALQYKEIALPSLEYFEAESDAEFESKVLNGVIYYIKDDSGCEYKAYFPALLSVWKVPNLPHKKPESYDYTIHTPFYLNNTDAGVKRVFDEIILEEGVTVFKLYEGGLYSPDFKILCASAFSGKKIIKLHDNFNFTSFSYYSANEYQTIFKNGNDEVIILLSKNTVGESLTLFIKKMSFAPPQTMKFYVYEKINTSEYSENKDILIYFYSEKKPKPTDTNLYWHFDASGNPVAW